MRVFRIVGATHWYFQKLLVIVYMSNAAAAMKHWPHCLTTGRQFPLTMICQYWKKTPLSSAGQMPELVWARRGILSEISIIPNDSEEVYQVHGFLISLGFKISVNTNLKFEFYGFQISISPPCIYSATASSIIIQGLSWNWVWGYASAQKWQMTA